MTDVEAKTPTKRRLPDKPNKKTPAKKVKVTPNKQQNKTSNKVNSPQSNGQKVKNKKDNESENVPAKKKLKPTVEAPKAVKPAKKQESGENKTTEKKRRPKKNIFEALKGKLSEDKEGTIKNLENKIKDIQNRGELSKSAKRKLKLFTRLKRFAEGGAAQPQKPSGNKAALKKNENKKKGTEIVKAGKQETKIAPKPAVGQTKKGQVNSAKAKTAAKVVDADEDEDEESDVDEEEDEDSDAEGEEESDDAEGEDVEEEDEGEESDDEGEEEEDSDEESEEDIPPQVLQNKTSPTKKVKLQKSNDTNNATSTVNVEDLKKNNLISKNQKRYVLFVGNIPYDTNKNELYGHFEKCGEIKHVRIPTEKKTTKPRGFAYVEVVNEETYQKCLSMHHTFLKGRRINVLYTQGGKKKAEDKKKEIKAKNFKLHAMRKEGKLAGSKKETQKRSFRRAKQKAIRNQNESLD